MRFLRYNVAVLFLCVGGLIFMIFNINTISNVSRNPFGEPAPERQVEQLNEIDILNNNHESLEKIATRNLIRILVVDEESEREKEHQAATENLEQEITGDDTIEITIENISEEEDLLGAACNSIIPEKFVGQRGNFTILYNYFQAERHYKCEESITYCTHGEYPYLLSHLEDLTLKWKGPVSVAVYAPGEDFELAVKSIQFLRMCGQPFIKQHASFHLFLDELPPGKSITELISTVPNISCDAEAQLLFGKTLIEEDTFRLNNKLKYPINTARNIARETSTTHFILSSDIEVYPSPNLISKFLIFIEDKLRIGEIRLKRPFIETDEFKKTVYAIPVFELHPSVSRLPKTVGDVNELKRRKLLRPFQYVSCKKCQIIPGQNNWLNPKYSIEGGAIEHVITVKRTGRYRSWHPVYIGTKYEPSFDERLYNEGGFDRSTQLFSMCLANYRFQVITGSFLIHRPKPNRSKKKFSSPKEFVDSVILPQLKKTYGQNNKCSL